MLHDKFHLCAGYSEKHEEWYSQRACHMMFQLYSAPKSRHYQPDVAKALKQEGVDEKDEIPKKKGGKKPGRKPKRKSRHGKKGKGRGKGKKRKTMQDEDAEGEEDEDGLDEDEDRPHET